LNIKICFTPEFLEVVPKRTGLWRHF